MSGDDYYYVFKRDGKYVVQCRFSSYTYSDDVSGGEEFDTFAEADKAACNAARNSSSEYGVVYDLAIERREA